MLRGEVEEPADRFHRVRIGGMEGDIVHAFAMEVDGSIVDVGASKNLIT